MIWEIKQISVDQTCSEGILKVKLMVKSSWLLNSSTLCRDLLIIVLGLERWVGLDWAHEINPQRWLPHAQMGEGSSYLSLKPSHSSVRTLHWKITDRIYCGDILNVFTTSSTKASPYNSFSSLPWDSSNIPYCKTKIRSCSKVVFRKSKYKN